MRIVMGWKRVVIIRRPNCTPQYTCNQGGGGQGSPHQCPRGPAYEAISYFYPNVSHGSKIDFKFILIRHKNKLLLKSRGFSV